MTARIANAEASARRAAARGLRVVEPVGIADWSEANRYLSDKEASEYGRFRNERIPFLRAIMDALDERHPAEVVSFMKSAQTGGTTVGQNWLGWTMHQSPATVMVLMPTEKIGLRWVRSKFRPMVRASPVLRGLVSLGSRRKVDGEEGTMQEIHFAGGAIYVASANIPDDMSMVSCRRLLLDEVDRFTQEIEKEGDPIELVQERFNTYKGRRKCFKISTPTDDASRIAEAYDESSRGKFFVPCPHCQAMQPLRWENLDYPEQQPALARYRCEECAALIDEHHKTEMLAAGEWRHERPELCETNIGFHINCLYVPTGLGDSWADNARKYERAKRDPAKLRVFENTRLGKIHRGQSIRLEAAELRRRTFDYRLRTIPRGVLILTAGADLQLDRIEVQIIGWSRNERITIIDYAVLPGSPTGTEVWNALDAYLAREIMNECGIAMRISCALVDSGNWQHEVTNFTRGLRNRQIFASKGSSVTTRPPIGRPTMVDVKYRGKADPRGAEQYQLGVHALKNTLFARLRADGELVDKRTEDAQAFVLADLMVRFPNELGEDYFDQVTAEKYDALKGRYVAIRERNEALDTLLMAMGAGMHHSVAVHKLRELDWQRLEGLYERKEGAKGVIDLGKTTLPSTLADGRFMPTVASVTRADTDY